MSGTNKFGVLSGSWTDRDPELVRALVPGKARRKAEEVSNKILLVFSMTVIIRFMPISKLKNILNPNNQYKVDKIYNFIKSV